MNGSSRIISCLSKARLVKTEPSSSLFLSLSLRCFMFCSKKKQCALYGKWTECLLAIDPAAFEARKKNNKKVAEEKIVDKEVGTVIPVHF